MASAPKDDHGFRDVGEWTRAVVAAMAGGPPDPRLGPPLPGPRPLTGDELEARLRWLEENPGGPPPPGL